MPFRAKIKRVLSRNSASSTDSRTESSNIYKSGEKMPMPKYRRAVAPEHKALLESFSFDTAWRRNSCASQYSPMGSRMPSRRNSISTPPRMSYHPARQHPLGSTLAMDGTSSVDGDSTDNESLSQLPTNTSSRGANSMSTSATSDSGSERAGQPWTQEELALALQRSTLAVPP
jgi:hypothetical protein